MTRPVRSLCWGLMIIFGACSDPVGGATSAPDLRVSVDSVHVGVDRHDGHLGVAMEVKIRNQGERSFVLALHCAVGLERFVDGRWNPAWTPPCSHDLPSLTMVPPGSEVGVRVVPPGGTISPAKPMTSEGPFPGEFRVRIAAVGQGSTQRELFAVSEPFRFAVLGEAPGGPVEGGFPNLRGEYEVSFHTRLRPPDGGPQIGGTRCPAIITVVDQAGHSFSGTYQTLASGRCVAGPERQIEGSVRQDGVVGFRLEPEEEDPATTCRVVSGSGQEFSGNFAGNSLTADASAVYRCEGPPSALEGYRLDLEILAVRR